jgi:hypothetical protein
MTKIGQISSKFETALAAFFNAMISSGAVARVFLEDTA